MGVMQLYGRERGWFTFYDSVPKRNVRRRGESWLLYGLVTSLNRQLPIAIMYVQNGRVRARQQNNKNHRCEPIKRLLMSAIWTRHNIHTVAFLLPLSKGQSLRRPLHNPLSVVIFAIWTFSELNVEQFYDDNHVISYYDSRKIGEWSDTFQLSLINDGMFMEEETWVCKFL